MREHVYFDEFGDPVAKKQLYDKGNGTKTAVWYRYENGKFVKGLSGFLVPLFNLPAVVSTTDTVFIVEGEKDAEMLFDNLRYTATTSPNGAGSKWKEEYNKFLKGRNVVILADNDDVGQAHAEQAADALLPIAKSVKLIPAASIYPKVKHKGDISDIVAELGIEKAKARLDEAVAIANIIAEPFTQERIQQSNVTFNIKPPDYSDAGNAEVYSRFYKHDLMFVDALGWLFWNGKRWEQDEHKATAFALNFSKLMLDDAKSEYQNALCVEAEAKAKFAVTDEESDRDALRRAKDATSKADAYLKHAKASRSAQKIRSMIDLSKPSLAVKANRLDAEPFDLNTRRAL